MRVQFTAIFQCLMGNKWVEINQEWKTRVVKTFRSSFWKMTITINSVMTFVRLGVEWFSYFPEVKQFQKQKWRITEWCDPSQRALNGKLLGFYFKNTDHSSLFNWSQRHWIDLRIWNWYELNDVSSCCHDFFHCLNSWFVSGFTFIIILGHFIQIQFIIVQNWMRIEVILIIWTHSPFHVLEKNLVIESAISCQNSYSIMDKLSVRRYSSGWNQRWWNIYIICKPINFKVSFVLLSFAISSWGWSCSIIAHEWDSNQGWMSKLRS
jgi:hypothetical protein